MKRKIITMAVIAVVLYGCSEENSTNATTSGIIETTTNQSPNNASSSTESAVAQQKTDAEVALEALSTIVDVANDAIDDKRRNDSIREANKDKVWAYQIGFEKTNKDDVFDIYGKLTALNVTGLYVFRKARKDYIIVKYEAKSPEELNNGLETFKAAIASVEPKVDVVNLMTFCSLKEVVKKDGEISKGKEDPIPCLTCLK